MKLFLRATTALVGLAGLTAAASAADLPRRAAPPPVFTPVPVFTWTGFYAGFNAGYGFGTQDDRVPTVIGVGPASLLVPPGTTAVWARPGFLSTSAVVMSRRVFPYGGDASSTFTTGPYSFMRSSCHERQ